MVELVVWQSVDFITNQTLFGTWAATAARLTQQLNCLTVQHQQRQFRPSHRAAPASILRADGRVLCGRSQTQVWLQDVVISNYGDCDSVVLRIVFCFRHVGLVETCAGMPVCPIECIANNKRSSDSVHYICQSCRKLPIVDLPQCHLSRLANHDSSMTIKCGPQLSLRLPACDSSTTWREAWLPLSMGNLLINCIGVAHRRHAALHLPPIRQRNCKL